MIKPLLLSAVILMLSACGTSEDGLLNYDPLGGDFTLTDHFGKSYTLSEHAGEVRLLFFGFTYCPDVCPTTLAEMKEVYALLGSAGDQLHTLFISIDAERDSPQLLQDYLGNFQIPVTGLSGTNAEVETIAGAYGAWFERVELDSAAVYTMDHSTRSYLIDGEGKVRYIFRYKDGPERIAYMARKLLE